MANIGARHLTIGKIYAAMIIYEYYKQYRKQQLKEEDEQVRIVCISIGEHKVLFLHNG